MLALFWAITGRKFKHTSSLQHGWSGRKEQTALPGALWSSKSRSKGRHGPPEWGPAGDRWARQAEHSLSSESVCANHFRRRWPRGGYEAHKGQTGLLFSRPGRKELHTSQSSMYLWLALGSNKITVHSQEHSGLLIYFCTDLLPFPFQRLYDIFILDPSLLTHTQHQREHLCSGRGCPRHART